MNCDCILSRTWIIQLLPIRPPPRKLFSHTSWIYFNGPWNWSALKAEFINNFSPTHLSFDSTHTHGHIGKRTHRRLCTYTIGDICCIPAHVCVCMYVCACTYIECIVCSYMLHSSTCMCMYVCMCHTYVHTMHEHTHTYIHIHICQWK